MHPTLQFMQVKVLSSNIDRMQSQLGGFDLYNEQELQFSYDSKQFKHFLEH
jgi:hypothetical protein